MGWYFLSEYQDFYCPGDPYGIVNWTHPNAYSEQLSGEFAILEDSLIRVTDLIEIVDLSRVGKKSIEDELGDCLEDSGIIEWVPPAWTLGSKLGLAKRSIRRHADTVAEFNAKLLAARKDDDKAAYIRQVLRRSVVIEYSGVSELGDFERKSNKMKEDFLGGTKAERREAIQGWSDDRLRACDELAEELCRCRRGFYVYNSIRCNYQKAASVIRRLIAEGPPPHFSADEGIGDVVDERGYNEMGSEWEHDSYMVETQDEEEITAVADAVAEDSDAEDAGSGGSCGMGRIAATLLRERLMGEMAARDVGGGRDHEWRSEMERGAHNLSSGSSISAGAAGGPGGDGSEATNPNFDGNDSIGDGYDADCEDGEEDNGSGQ